jgi:choline-sulfatase
MKRREFMKTAAATVVGVAPALHASGEVKRRRKCNILFIMTDQQAATMMSCTGNKWLKTPNLDRLAASGIRFERAYASNPVCVPSRYSLQTGLMPSAIGMGRNEDSPRSTVSDEMIHNSLGRLLQSAGYETVYGGKVHLPKRMNNVRDIGYRSLTRDSRQDLADACAEFIKGPHDKPFFLFASFINPHDICYMAINDFRRTEGQEPIGNTDSKVCEATLDRARSSGDVYGFIESKCPPLPTNHEIPKAEPQCITEQYANVRPFRAYIRKNWTEKDWRLHRWAYCRLAEMVDEKIGVVLDALREAGLEEDTLIVFTSDHGDMDSAHKMEHKSVLYEEAVRIPFLMSCKGTIPAGKVNDTHFVSNGLDLMPTLCDYAGVEVPEGREGRSVRPLAEGKAAGRWRGYVAVESQNGRMVRTERFKYCLYDSGERREQLTDMRNDPGEMNNLAGDEKYRDVLDRHRQLMRRWVKKIDDRIGANYIDVT